MARGNRYNWIYDRLDKITGGIKEFASKPGNYRKFKSSGFMDLCVECVCEGIVSLTHYYEQNGDLVPDPDMEVRVYDNSAEALTFQMNNIYQQVYTDDGKRFYPALKRDLNKFLHFWLCNLEKQGFY